MKISYHDYSDQNDHGYQYYHGIAQMSWRCLKKYHRMKIIPQRCNSRFSNGGDKEAKCTSCSFNISHSPLFIFSFMHVSLLFLGQVYIDYLLSSAVLRGYICISLNKLYSTIYGNYTRSALPQHFNMYHGAELMFSSNCG